MQNEPGFSEFQRLELALREVTGGLLRIPPLQDESDERLPDQVCWAAKNVWRYPEDPSKPDVQLAVWHGQARVRETQEPQSRLESGLWCSVGIERRDAFRAWMPGISPERYGDAVRALPCGFRLALGWVRIKSTPYTEIDAGLPARQIVDFAALFRAIEDIMEMPGPIYPRPHLHIYKKIGDWMSPENTAQVLAQRITIARDQLSGVFRLVTHERYP